LKASFINSSIRNRFSRARMRKSSMGSSPRHGSVVVPAVAAFCVILSVVVAFASLLAAVAAEESADGDKAGDVVAARFALSRDGLLKLKVRDLKEMLKRKGASCDACVSKSDLVERIAEVREWNDVHEKQKLSDPADGLDSEVADDMEGLSSDERLEKLTEKLRKIDPSIRTFTKGKDGKMDEAEIERMLRKPQKMRKSKQFKSTKGSRKSKAAFDSSDDAEHRAADGEATDTKTDL
jgi:ARMET, C-terminal